MATKTMTQSHRGVALLVAVIFAAVMLAFGILLGSLAYKQTLLTQSVRESQSAFYTADTGMECLLYADQSLNEGRGVFSDGNGISLVPGQQTGAFHCDGNLLTLTMAAWEGGSYATTRVNLTGGRCVDLKIYKPAEGIGKTWIFSQGYTVDCNTVGSPNGARFSSRGLRAHY